MTPLRDRRFRPWLVFTASWNLSQSLGGSLATLYLLENIGFKNDLLGGHVLHDDYRPAGHVPGGPPPGSDGGPLRREAGAQVQPPVVEPRARRAGWWPRPGTRCSGSALEAFWARCSPPRPQTRASSSLPGLKGNIVEISDITEGAERDKTYNYPDVINGLPEKEVSEKILAKLSEPYKYKPSSGQIIGTHNGAHFFTIGQRKGINVGGHKEALFVIGTDVEKNVVYVGEGQSHQGLNRKGLFIRNDETHWIRTDLKMQEGESRDYMVRIRYRQPLQTARLFCRNTGMYIIFDKPQRGIAPGQFAAWYDGEELIGSGVINR